MLVELTARGFRNLDPLTWGPGAGSHLLLGDNGAGKTSLLEAVYALATTRSFRTPRLAECRRHGESAFHLVGEVEEGPGANWTRLELSLVDSRRERRLNGSTPTLAEHLAVLPVVAWTSADGELIQGPPEVRRRFLDRGVLGVRPPALAVLGRYRRALAQKRELLQRGPAPTVLQSWNAVLAAAAMEVIAVRREYVRRLESHFEAVLRDFALDFPPVRLAYRPSPALVEDDETEGGVLAALETAAPEECRRGLPLVGPHRDDLRIAWADRQLRRDASAGERKAIGLALLAAHGRVLEAADRDPIYLLDDADTELSTTTLVAVWRGFEGARQLLASSNRPEVWEEIPISARWHLRKGVLRGL
jgi:DNA replication and repair protein RecF